MNNKLKMEVSLQTNFSKVSAEVKEVGSNISGLSQTVQQVEKNLKDVGSTVQGVGTESNTHLKRIGDGIDRNIVKQLKSINAAAVVDIFRDLADVLAGLSAPALTFEQSMADLSAITGATGQELEDLGRTAREVGKQSGLGAAESARAFAVLAGQIDVPTEQLKELQRQTITLAQAGAIPLEIAASAVAGTLNQFGLQAGESARVVNVLAAGSRAGGAEVNDLAESMKIVGAAANGAGVSLEETAGAIEVLANNNTKGAEAGTALRNVILALQTRLGIDTSKEGLAGGLAIVNERLNAIQDPVERTTFLTKAFGRENVTAAQFLLQNAQSLHVMTAQVTGTNAAVEQAEIRNDTWAHKIEVARAKMDDLKISLAGATGALLPMASVMSEQMVSISMLVPLYQQLSSVVSRYATAETLATVKRNLAMIAQGQLNAVMAANPIGAVVAALGLLAGAFTLAYKHNEEFRGSVDRAKVKLQEMWVRIREALMPAIAALGNAVIGFFEGPAGQYLSWYLDFYTKYLAGIVNLIAKIIEGLTKFNQFTVGWNLITGHHDRNVENVRSFFGIEGKQPAPTPEPSPMIPAGRAGELLRMGRERVGANITTEAGILKDIKLLKMGIEKTDGEDKKQLQELLAYDERRLAAMQRQRRERELASMVPDIQVPTGGGAAAAVGAISETTQKSNKVQQELREYVNRLKELAAQEPGISAVAGAAERFREAWAPKDAEAPAFVSEIEQVPVKAIPTLKQMQEAARQTAGEVGGALNSIGSAMGAFGNVLGDGAAAWLRWGQQVLSSISQVLPQLAALFSANMGAAVSGLFASESFKGVIGIITAVAGVASMIATVASVPRKFASGGIVYGPTYGMVGEYPGAASNPEVIAPLSKLRGLLGGGHSDLGGEVRFRIEGRTLVGILSKEERYRKM